MALARKLGAPVLPFTMCGYHKQTVPTITSFFHQNMNLLFSNPLAQEWDLVSLNQMDYNMQ